MNENDPVEDGDTDEESSKGLLAGGAAGLGGAGTAAKGALDKAREAAAAAKDAAGDAVSGATDAASGAKDAATGAVSGATDAAGDAASGVQGGVGDAFSGASDAASGAASGVQGGVGDAFSGASDAVSGATDAASGAVSGATDAASGAISGATDAVSGAASNVQDAGGAAVSGAADAASGATSGVSGAAAGVVAGGAAASAAVAASATPQNAATPQQPSTPQDDDRGAAVAAGAAATGASAGATTQLGGGSGGSGSSGGSGGSGGGDDDDDKIIAAAPISGDNQIVILGLLVFLFMFFGAAIWAFLGFGDDADSVVLGDVSMEELAEENPECAAVLSALQNSDELEAEDFEDVTCTSEDGDVTLVGEVASTGVQSSVAAVAAGAAATLDTEGVTVAEEEEVEEEVVEEEPEEQVAAPETTTTTEAPETTTTTEAPETTTTEAPAAEAVTMWDALLSSGEATQFSVIGGALGLQADLEALEDADGNPVMRTLFAPSDAALTALGPEAIASLSSDPDAASALVGYHFIDEVLTAEDLVALDGETVTTRTQLPLNVAVVDGNVVLNGTTTVTSTDFVADNGIVHIVDVVLEPPTLNQVLDLDNIEFDSAQATITAAGQGTLGIAVDFFEANPTVNATIEGHTDTDGGDDFNQELSQARADAVLQFLVDAGLDAERFNAIGFGETQPVLVDGVEDKEASRRIEFVAR